MKRTLACLLLAILATASLTAADKTAAPAAPASAPAKEAPAAKPAERNANLVTISADRMEMEVGQKILLEGNVLVEDARMCLTSDHVTIFFEQAPKKEGRAEKEKDKEKEGGFGDFGSGKVSGIEATGGVMIRTVDGKRSATGDRGTYDPEKDTYILDGNCTILADGHTLKSSRVIFDRKKQTFTAGRASITLHLGGGEGDGHKGDLGGIFGLTEEKKADKSPEDGGKPAEAQGDK